jgi:hypothetical protein
MYGNSIVRSTREMYKFADFIDLDYSARIEKICREMEGEMDTSRALLNDEVSKKGVAKTKGMIEELLKGLPVIKEAAEKLRESARWLDQASSIGL